MRFDYEKLQHAVQAIETFCHQHGLEHAFDQNAIVAISGALATRSGYDWAPCGIEIAKLYILNPDRHQGRVALVIGHGHGTYEPKEDLTIELNDMIAQYTDGAYGVRKPAPPAPGIEYVSRLDSKPSWVRPGLTMLPGKWYAIGDEKIIHLADVAEGWNLTLPVRMSLFATTSEVWDREAGRSTLISSTLNQIDAERYLAAIERLEQRHADSIA